MLIIFARRKQIKFALKRNLDWLCPGRGTKGLCAGVGGDFFFLNDFIYF